MQMQKQNGAKILAKRRQINSTELTVPLYCTQSNIGGWKENTCIMENTVVSLQTFLAENNLAMYLEAFIETGYDDLKQLKDIITSEDQLEIDSLLRDVDLDKKPGHRRRFISAMPILCYQSNARNAENGKEAASTSRTHQGKIVKLPGKTL